MAFAISFDLGEEFWEKVESIDKVKADIKDVFKVHGFEQSSKNSLYISKSANSVLSVLTAQRLCKIPHFSKYVSNFNLLRIDEISSLAPLSNAK